MIASLKYFSKTLSLAFCSSKLTHTESENVQAFLSDWCRKFYECTHQLNIWKTYSQCVCACVREVNSGPTFFSWSRKIHNSDRIEFGRRQHRHLYSVSISFTYTTYTWIHEYICIQLELRASLSLAWLSPVSFEKRKWYYVFFSLSLSLFATCVSITSKRFADRSLNVCIRCYCCCCCCCLLCGRFHHIWTWTLGDQYELEINSDGFNTQWKH